MFLGRPAQSAKRASVVASLHALNSVQIGEWDCNEQYHKVEKQGECCRRRCRRFSPLSFRSIEAMSLRLDHLLAVNHLLADHYKPKEDRIVDP